MPGGRGLAAPGALAGHGDPSSGTALGAGGAGVWASRVAGWPHGVRSGLLTAGRPAASAQVHAGLGQDAVDEAVRPSGCGSQGSDALPGVVALLQLLRQLVSLGTGHAGALL